MPLTTHLEEVLKLKGGENSHQKADLYVSVDEHGKPIGRLIYDADLDNGKKVRIPGWTNIGDISACLRTDTGLGDVYANTETPHIAVSSKHTRPVAIAYGRTQVEAAVKAIAGDVNSPFGGFLGFNTPLTAETAQFIHKMFIEGVVAPEYESGTADILKARPNRFLLETGQLTLTDVDLFDYTMTPVAFGNAIKQDREVPFDARKECTVITGNGGNPDINSLDASVIADIHFAGNAAIYLSSNLVFYVHDGAVAGLGDGCGARVVAARKARNMLEDSVYAAIAMNDPEEWDRVLYDTPFTRADFEGVIKKPIRITAFSDAFYPKIDGYVETAGIDRIDRVFANRKYMLKQKVDGETRDVAFIPKRRNFDPDYCHALLPVVVVQPAGCMGDRYVVPLAEKHGIVMVATMPLEKGLLYSQGKKDPDTGRTPTGRRFFGHNPMM